MRDDVLLFYEGRPSDILWEIIPIALLWEELLTFTQKTFRPSIRKPSSIVFCLSLRKHSALPWKKLLIFSAETLWGIFCERTFWPSMRKPSYLLLKGVLDFFGKNFCSSMGKPFWYYMREDLLVFYERRPSVLLWEKICWSSMRPDCFVWGSFLVIYVNDLLREELNLFYENHFCEHSIVRRAIGLLREELKVFS